MRGAAQRSPQFSTGAGRFPDSPPRYAGRRAICIVITQQIRSRRNTLRYQARVRIGAVLAAMLWSGPAAFGQWTESLRPADTLATVGDAVINAEEFLERFELQPWLDRETSRTSDEIRRDVLFSLVAEKLLAREAARRAIGQDPLSLDERRMLERLFVRDELYRDVVRSKARAPEEAVVEGMRRYATSIRIALYKVAGEPEGKQLVKRLRKAGTKPLRTPFPPDTLVVHFGMSEPDLEDAVYATADSCLGPLQIELYDWVVARILERCTNPDYAARSIPERLEEVTKVVRQRSEDSIASDYVASVLRLQKAELQKPSFNLLVDSLRSLFNGDPQRYRVKGWFLLLPEGVDSLMARCANRLDEIAVLIATGPMTLRDVLIGMKVTANEFPSTELSAIRRTLHHLIGVVIRDELLAREGFRLGMQDSAAVRHDLAQWTEARNAALLQQRFLDSVTVSDEEITRFITRNSGSFGVETRINLQEILTSTDSAAQSLKERIRSGEDMARLARRYTIRDEWRGTDGVSGYFPASKHADLAFQAVVADSGVITGPFAVEGGYSIFRVLGIRYDPDSARAKGVDVRGRARDQLYELKARRRMDNVISDLAMRDQVSMREDRLRMINVTPTSMMTWRYIGFGGRINAVPTLIPETGWVDRWKSLRQRSDGARVVP